MGKKSKLYHLIHTESIKRRLKTFLVLSLYSFKLKYPLTPGKISRVGRLTDECLKSFTHVIFILQYLLLIKNLHC